MKKEHKHKWYETALMKEDRSQKSYACECGAWKIERESPDYNKLQVVKFGYNK